MQWRYGRDAETLASLRQLLDPDLRRQEYPEASFCTIGAMAAGLMGIQPNAKEGRLVTTPGLGKIAWAEMNRVPFLGRLVSVHHDGDSATTLRLEEGKPLDWRCRFWGAGFIRAAGDLPKQTWKGLDDFSGRPFIQADFTLYPGQTLRVLAVREVPTKPDTDFC